MAIGFLVGMVVGLLTGAVVVAVYLTDEGDWHGDNNENHR